MKSPCWIFCSILHNKLPIFIIISTASSVCDDKSNYVLDVLYLNSRATYLNPFFYACEAEGDFSATLSVINTNHPGSRAAIVSSTTPSLCFIKHQNFSAGTALIGFHSHPTADTDHGVAMQSAIIALQDESLNWAHLNDTRNTIRKIVVLTTSGAPAPIDSTKNIFHDSCSQSPPSAKVSGSKFREHDARLIVFAHNDATYKAWLDYAKQMEIIYIIKRFKGIVGEFQNLAPSAIEDVLCSEMEKKSTTGVPIIGVAAAFGIGGLTAVSYLAYRYMEQSKEPLAQVSGYFEDEEQSYENLDDSVLA